MRNIKHWFNPFFVLGVVIALIGDSIADAFYWVDDRRYERRIRMEAHEDK